MQINLLKSTFDTREGGGYELFRFVQPVNQPNGILYGEVISCITLVVLHLTVCTKGFKSKMAAKKFNTTNQGTINRI